MGLVLTIVARWFLKYMLTMLMRTMMMMTMVMMVTMLTIVAGWFGKLQTCLLTFVCHHQIFSSWLGQNTKKNKQLIYCFILYDIYNCLPPNLLQLTWTDKQTTYTLRLNENTKSFYLIDGLLKWVSVLQFFCLPPQNLLLLSWTQYKENKHITLVGGNQCSKPEHF